MKLAFAILFTASFLIWVGVRTIAGINFDRNCEGYLKRAADANTIDLAIENLKVATKYAEQNGMTSGFTSIMYRTPNEDIGFWYKNLTASLKELRVVKPDTPQLEKTNILMKLRETLLDQNSITSPPGISIYPSNGSYAMWSILSFFLGFVFWIMWVGDNSY
ncbi:MAG: hypothetical protein A3A96_00760 [Candidatus Zambryskibacteria bacterium RIFCSPLOWO2_01_FULL_39_39]|uniref:Uncharacterized protein n=1 Tax=Candidatus Zambryskibacteria bacterium RIFCSPLOWO2_01_FULL_39_39 TaxID=1802758 RepID=A0A1G2TXE7_9BACT|nr:MAG: hypothetical protein A2644_01135 [Candidatus Zambryskibacteria bacterium RIFCSPHIGHO2_01_FULL_39_63]OHA95014.1 MAG: hypothetical protein A3B88_01380 [Candidatus Zambryskibacteria bacterium RIFCSPHIGHO2_02_FULL_39_19]OHA99195.1 MAG: hypothetical protein A3F20_03330 [Candidatus Zambryskibacteria bacterium RIFCSPHIGHO2_12_FULL_39_21]OHB01957.1 MAG: hypothetical protein A3A96_00760 [Candidatus Zambryskibacteria bacterium RIFCSPLOWO2_01_FULL_39_39]